MRRNSSSKSSRAHNRRRGLLRMLAGEQSGFSIVEVVVAALILTLLSGAVATALISTARFSGDERKRSQANELAQQDQDRMRGLPIKALAPYSNTRAVTLDGTAFSIKSTGKFISTAGDSSCTTSGTAAAYVLIRSEVSWTANRRPPIVQRSLITPNPGGTLLTKVNDQTGTPLPGATVTALSAETVTGTTDSDGCTIFTGLTQTAYFVRVEQAGAVDVNGVNPTYGVAGVTASGTSYPDPPVFRIGQAGAIQASFTSNNGTLTGQLAPSLSVSNPGRNAGTPLVTTPASPTAPITTPQTLFPFWDATTLYANNYSAWAGKCAANRPPAGANRISMGVGPGLTPTTPAVKEPAMKVTVQYPSGTNVKPAAIRLTYAQTAPTTCSEAWTPALAAGSTTPANGWLATPGQPYAGSYTESSTTYTGSYTVCASYDTNGAAAGGVRWGARQNQSNSDFAAITTVPTIVISNTDSPGTSGPNSCPVL